MADKGHLGTHRARPAQLRLKTLAQTALNADVTVGQVDALLLNMSATLTHLDHSADGLDQTLGRFNVGVGEAVVSPISATENAVRGVVNPVRSRTGR